MKLFLSTNSDTVKTENVKLLNNTVKSAIENTEFEIFVIFDGKKSELSLPSSVNIIEHRHRCYDTFVNSDKDLITSSGAFLRTEIPILMDSLGIKDEYCLYTDYDVIFQKKDYSELDNLKPKYFAVCPEIKKNDWSYFNTGVMLLNVNTLKTEDEKIIKFINDNFGKVQLPYGSYDQPIMNFLFKDKFDRLPLEYNWKPYWGINEDAKIIHFHGAKPESVEPKLRYELPVIKNIRNMNIEGYNYYNSLFEKYS